MIALDKISDFNEVMQFYDRTFKFIKKLRNNIKIDELKDEVREIPQSELIAYYRARISSETLRIVQIEEMFDSSPAVNSEINKFFEGQSILDSFVIPGEPNANEKYKIRQLRNCLVHSDYNIGISENGEDVYIYINSDKIKGTMSIDEFIEIASKYNSWYNNFTQYKNVGLLSYDVKTLDIKDKKKAINKFVRSFKISNQVLSEERISKLKKWIEKIGIERFKISGKTKEELDISMSSTNVLVTDLINCSAEKDDDMKVYEPIKENYDTLTFDFLLSLLQIYFNDMEMSDFANDESAKNKQKKAHNQNVQEFQDIADSKSDNRAKKSFNRIKDIDIDDFGIEEYKKNIRKILSILSTKKPFVYSDTLMSLSYYIFNYVREINESRDKKIFDYSDIDTSGFKIISNGDGVDFSRIERLKKEYEEEKNPKRKVVLKKQIDKYVGNFFKQIRNSISHGYYKIDYSKYFNTRNIDDIMFSFPTQNFYTKLMDFETQISAKDLLNVISKFREKIIQGIDVSTDGMKVETEALREALTKRGVKTSDLKNDRKNNLESQEMSRVKSKQNNNHSQNDGR